MKALSLLVKPASGACMYACRYCFYADEMSLRASGVRPLMSEETLETLVRKAFSACDGSITFAFQGGEPMLAGLGFYRRLTELEKRYRTTQTVMNSLQTNGALMDEEWASFFAENGFLIGLSLDGPKELHDACRVDKAGEGTYDRTRRAAELLAKSGAMFNVLCVVSSRNVTQPERLWEELAPYGYIQFIPCLDGFEGEGERFSPSAEEYGDFLVRTFDLYERAIREGCYVSVRYFDNLIRLLRGGRPESCSMNGRCCVSLTVESDGSLYPCDFYVLDKWCLGNINTADIPSALRGERAEEFVNKSVFMSEECKRCSRFSLCRGGCRREREPFVDGHTSLNRYCASYRFFFDKRLEKLRELAVYTGRFTNR